LAKYNKLKTLITLIQSSRNKITFNDAYHVTSLRQIYLSSIK